MQAGGQRFDPVILHQDPQAETSVKQGCLTLAFEKSNATLFNKTEEGCVTRADEAWVMRCDCIDCYTGSVMIMNKMSLPVAALAREHKVIGSSD